MKKFVWIALPLLGLTFVGSCGPKAPESGISLPENSSEASPTPAPSEGPGEEGPVLSLAPPAPGGNNTTGITPMDVAVGAPRPAVAPPSVPAAAGEGPGGEQTGGTTAIQLPANLPPGVPIPDLSAFGGDLVLESVTVSEAAPGEGPIGPDGQVVDPNSIIIGNGGEPALEPDTQPKIGLAPAPRPPSSSGRKLDPSEGTSTVAGARGMAKRRKNKTAYASSMGDFAFINAQDGHSSLTL